jgi:hypothetical protein
MGLLNVCATNDWEKTNGYLDAGVEPDKILAGRVRQGYCDAPILVLASLYNSVEVAQRLVEAHANVNLTTKPEPGSDFGKSALHAAVDALAFEAVEYLLQTEIDRNLKDENGMTPLMRFMQGNVVAKNFDLGITAISRLQDLESDDIVSRRLINACGGFAFFYMRPRDVWQLMQGAGSSEELLSRLRRAMFNSLLPGKKGDFIKEVFEEGHDIADLESMFKPAKEYAKEILLLLLTDPRVDVATVDKHRNTVLHLAAERIIAASKNERDGRNFALAVELFEILMANGRVQWEIDHALTNNDGKSVQQCVNEALQCIRDRAAAAPADEEEAHAEDEVPLAEEERLADEEERLADEAARRIEEAVRRIEEARVEAQFAGRIKKVSLVVGSTVAVLGASFLLARRYDVGTGLLGKVWRT